MANTIIVLMGMLVFSCFTYAKEMVSNSKSPLISQPLVNTQPLSVNSLDYNKVRDCYAEVKYFDKTEHALRSQGKYRPLNVILFGQRLQVSNQYVLTADGLVSRKLMGPNRFDDAVYFNDGDKSSADRELSNPKYILKDIKEIDQVLEEIRDNVKVSFADHKLGSDELDPLAVRDFLQNKYGYLYSSGEIFFLNEEDLKHLNKAICLCKEAHIINDKEAEVAQDNFIRDPLIKVRNIKSEAKYLDKKDFNCK